MINGPFIESPFNFEGGLSETSCRSRAHDRPKDYDITSLFNSRPKKYMPRGITIPASLIMIHRVSRDVVPWILYAGQYFTRRWDGREGGWVVLAE